MCHSVILLATRKYTGARNCVPLFLRAAACMQAAAKALCLLILFLY